MGIRMRDKKTLRSAIVLLITSCCTFASSINANASDSASENCSAYLSLIGQEGFLNTLEKIPKIKAFGFLKSHKVVFFQKGETDQVVVLLGENHFNSKSGMEIVNSFAKHFQDIAIEREDRDRDKQKAYAAKSTSKSNIEKSLLLESAELRVHLIDTSVPAVFEPVNMLIGLMTQALYYLSYAYVALFTSSGSPQILMQKLVAPPAIVAIPMTVMATVNFLYVVDALAGVALHALSAFKAAKYLPLTNYMLNRRNEFMVQKINDLMEDQETRRKNLLFIGGRMHLLQMVNELEKRGFQKIIPEK